VHKTIQACFFGALVVLTYGIYIYNNPGADGAIFAAVVGTLCAIGGYTAGVKRNVV
jgi:hypothetical protein